MVIRNSRPWVTRAQGRAQMLGTVLYCKKCDNGETRDNPA